ncbi:MAG: thioredoxin [Bacteroidetes bacterium HGW-Bacteroidetes-21]|nr:MAG: thioredoxin [Bacteroidetes bacterium HGW-Bacteroidetes-21]
MKPVYFLIIVAILATGGVIYSFNNSKPERKSVEQKKSTSTESKVAEENSLQADENGIIHLTQETFKKEVFDYTASKEWKYLGNKPAIIDFYADWCRPCKMLAPTLEELQKEYGGKIQIYKVNTDKNPELSNAFGIQGIPALLFIPATGEPQMSTGLLPKETLESNITTILQVKK